MSLNLGTLPFKGVCIGEDNICHVYLGEDLVGSFCEYGDVCTTPDYTMPVPNEVDSVGDWVSIGGGIVGKVGAPENGSYCLSIFSSVDDSVVQSGEKDFPLVNGREYSISLWARKTTGVNQAVNITGGIGLDTTFTGITSTWQKFETSGTATANGYITIVAVTGTIKSTVANEDIYIDNIEIKELPYDLYPQGDAAQMVNDINSIGVWVSEFGESSIQTGHNSNYSIRVIAKDEGGSSPIGEITKPLNVKSGRTLTIEFDAKAYVAGSGAAQFILSEGAAISPYQTETLVTGDVWTHYSIETTPNIWGLLYIGFQVGDTIDDYIDFDNIKITQALCV